jgi:hypothetical protein
VFRLLVMLLVMLITPQGGAIRSRPVTQATPDPLVRLKKYVG